MAKTIANRAKAIAYWNSVRAGARPFPRRLRLPPTPDVIAGMLADFCRSEGITLLEAFGSTARGDARAGSDVDLLASFEHNPGLRFFQLEGEMARILGVPVHLLTRDSVEQMTNPYRRESILGDAKVIYRG